MVKNLPVMWETWVRSLSWENSPGWKEWLPTPVFWPGESHGLCSSWGHKESDMTEQIYLDWHLSALRRDEAQPSSQFAKPLTNHTITIPPASSLPFSPSSIVRVPAELLTDAELCPATSCLNLLHAFSLRPAAPASLHSHPLTC